MNTSSSRRRGGGRIMEEAFIIIGLILTQLIFAGYTLALHSFLARGVNHSFMIIFFNLFSVFMLLPFALLLEKKRWPKRLSPMLLLQFLLITVSGIAYQVFMMLANQMTSPAIVCSMPNLAPAIIFIVSACCRFERFSIRCKYSRAKIVGTILCLSGAILMGLLISSPSDATSNALTLSSISTEWLLGCVYLFIAVLLMSIYAVLQAAVMVDFPAPFSLCIIASLMTAALTFAWEFMTEGGLNLGTSGFKLHVIISFVLVGGAVFGLYTGFQTWCVEKKGPVMVSIFNPFQTVFSAVLSALALGQVFTVGSIAGMILMFVGLYVFLWAKTKEERVTASDANTEAITNVEEPLLA